MEIVYPLLEHGFNIISTTVYRFHFQHMILIRSCETLNQINFAACRFYTWSNTEQHLYMENDTNKLHFHLRALLNKRTQVQSSSGLLISLFDVLQTNTYLYVCQVHSSIIVVSCFFGMCYENLHIKLLEMVSHTQTCKISKETIKKGRNHLMYVIVH